MANEIYLLSKAEEEEEEDEAQQAQSKAAAQEEDLAAAAEEEESEEPEQEQPAAASITPADPSYKMRLVRIALPWFAMTCETDAQAKDYQERRAKLKQEKQARQDAAKKMEQEEAAATAGAPKRKPQEQEQQAQGRARSEGRAPAKAGGTAADHTYDKGYKRWEKFDVDAALQEVDTARDERKEPQSPALAPAATRPNDNLEGRRRGKDGKPISQVSECE